MAGLVTGRLGWSVTRDEEGFRTYRVSHLVRTLYADGPQTAMTAAGLPIVGTAWNFGNDYDLWAFCYPTLSVTIHKEKKGEPNKWWKVEQTFSNKPLNRCQDETIEDPLLEPQKVSGTFVKDTLEAGKGYTSLAAAAVGGDRTKRLMTSSHEPLRGANVDTNHPTVRIEQNVATLGLATFSEMVDTVNDATLWGLAKRKIKLSNVSWERKILATCDYYYTRVFDFDVDFKTFDRKEHDYGKMALGKWEKVGFGIDTWISAGLDKTDPTDFTRYKDKEGYLAETLLDGNGIPVTNEDDAAEIDIIYYEESDFLELGIPTVF